MREMYSHPPTHGKKKRKHHQPHSGVFHEEDVDVVPCHLHHMNTKSKSLLCQQSLAQITVLLFVRKPQSELYCQKPCCTKSPCPPNTIRNLSTVSSTPAANTEEPYFSVDNTESIRGGFAVSNLKGMDSTAFHIVLRILKGH